MCVRACKYLSITMCVFERKKTNKKNENEKWNKKRMNDEEISIYEMNALICCFYTSYNQFSHYSRIEIYK